jgi:regulator of RNase E activity RraB
MYYNLLYIKTIFIGGFKMGLWDKLKLNKPVRLTVTGFVDGESQEECLELDMNEAVKLLPEVIKCLVDRFIPEVEKIGHRYNGWQITSVIFEATDAEVRTPADFEWDELKRIGRANGTDLSDREIDEKTGHFID